MSTGAADFVSYRFSTRELPERMRIPLWRENLGRGIVHVNIEPLSDVLFQADAAQTFSKLVVTSADIKLLLRAIEADEAVVHAAYYIDDECIARIAAWIAAKDDMHSNAAIAA